MIDELVGKEVKYDLDKEFSLDREPFSKVNKSYQLAGCDSPSFKVASLSFIPLS